MRFTIFLIRKKTKIPIIIADNKKLNRLFKEVLYV